MNFRINSIENRYQHRFFFSFLFMKQSVFKHGPKEIDKAHALEHSVHFGT